MRTSRPLCLMVLSLALWLVPGLRAAETASRPPNILFLLADDLRYDGLGCMGNQVLKTPNIDSLAQRGTLFRRAFVTTSICCVSRASIFSGQYMRRHGIEDFQKQFTPEQWTQSYPARLKAAGYRTGFIGKFGVGSIVLSNAFDFWAGFPGQGRYYEPGNTEHLTARMGTQALGFLAGCAPGQPWCLQVSFKAPHAQDGAPREFPADPRDESLYGDEFIRPSDTTEAKYFESLPEFVRVSEGRKRWQRRFSSPDLFEKTTRDYYRLVSGIDREVGRMIDGLRERGMLDNTIIVFFSDNGFFFGEHGMADKWLMYEESIRVPMIIVDPRLPKREQGHHVDSMVLNIDVAPTILDYAGVTAPAVMQGQSLRPWVEGQKVPGWRTEFFYEHHTLPKIIPPSEGVRTERWSYIRYIGVNPPVEELYDIRRDPAEKHNLILDKGHEKELAELRAKWEQYGTSLR